MLIYGTFFVEHFSGTPLRCMLLMGHITVHNVYFKHFQLHIPVYSVHYVYYKH